MKIILSIALLSTAASLMAEDWTRFRGNDGSGIARDATPAKEWSDSQNLKWKYLLPGPGSSSPVISGDRIFVTSYSGYGDGSEGEIGKLTRHLVCVSRTDGKKFWEVDVPALMPEDPYEGYITEHGYASSTPTTDGERVYVFFGKTGILAFDFTGKELWRVNVGQESGNRRWGSGASPILFKNLLIVNASEESKSIRGLDKLTGKEVWKADSSTLELCYSTPSLMEVEGRTDLLLAVPGELWGLNPETGKLRWYSTTGISGNVSPSVTVADGIIYVTGGFPGLSSAAVRGGGKGDVTQSHLLWTSKNASYVPSPVVDSGRLFVATDQGFAMCSDAKDGGLVFRERLPGASARGGASRPCYASAVLVNGLVYAVSRSGGTYIFEANSEFKLIGQNIISSDPTDFNATPAISGSQLFLRSNRYLYCIEQAQTETR